MLDRDERNEGVGGPLADAHALDAGEREGEEEEVDWLEGVAAAIPMELVG